MNPYTTAESLNPGDLWKWMQTYEQQTGGKLLAIARNGNLSNGTMFPVETNSTGLTSVSRRTTPFVESMGCVTPSLSICVTSWIGSSLVLHSTCKG